MDRVEAHERVEPVVAQVLADRLHLVASCRCTAPSARRSRGPDELEDAEEADVAAGAHARVLLLQPRVVGAHDRAHPGGALDEPVLLVDRDRGDRRRAADRVDVVRQPAGERPVGEDVRDRAAHHDRAERQVGRRQALRHRQQVGHDVPVVDREPAAGAPEAAHDLVGDQEDAVAVADLADALEVAVGRDEDPVRADDRLEDEGRDRVRALEHDDLLEVCEGCADRVAVRAAPAVRVRGADDAGHARLRGPAARVAGRVITWPVAP